MRRNEEVAHARVKATMAPGPAAAKRFAEIFPFPGAWSALATLEMLKACPPDAAHTGPDGDLLCSVPLVVDIDAEFMGCYSVHGPGVPRGPAAYARTTLAMARLMISHVHGTAIYGRDPSLTDDDEKEAFDNGASTLNSAAELSTSRPASALAPRGPVPGKDATADDAEGVTASYVEQDNKSASAGKKRRSHPAPQSQHDLRLTRLRKRLSSVDPVFLVDNTKRSATSTK